MDPSHPSQSRLWHFGIGFALVCFAFFSFNPSRFSGFLAAVAFGFFVAGLTGLIVAKVLYRHAVWSSLREWR